MAEIVEVRFFELDDADRQLIAAAAEVLRARYEPDSITVASAVRCAGGRIYTGVNLDGSGFGPCAEQVALGAAVTAGETGVEAVVAVCRRGDDYPVLSPCGNCRQMMLRFAPEAVVILDVGGRALKAAVADLLPGPYGS